MLAFVHEHSTRRGAGLAAVAKALLDAVSRRPPSRSASFRMMLADLPPSSWVTRFTESAAALATSTPARVDPVIDTMSMSGCFEIAAPTPGPSPLTRLNTPAKARPPASMISARMMRAQRRHLARLEHNRATCRKRGRDLAHDLVGGPVPRRDETADPDGLFDDERVAAGFAGTRSPLKHSRAPW